MKKQQLQTQKQLSAYERKTIHDIFRDMMEVLEKYIEKAGYYPDWQARKQIYDNNVTRKFDSIEEGESIFSANLFGLKLELKDRPPFFLEELKEEYYKWIESTGIDVNNCPERLKHYLFEIHEVLEGRGDKFAQKIAQESHEHVQKMSDEEFSKRMNEAFGAFQAPLQKERKTAEELEGRTYKEITVERKFSGNVEQGREAFQRIAITAPSHETGFHFFPSQGQQSTSLIDDENSDIIRDVQHNSNSWKIENIRGQAWLIHNAAHRVDSEIGSLIHNKERFTGSEWTAIRQAVNSQQQSQQVEINQEATSNFFSFRRGVG